MTGAMVVAGSAGALDPLLGREAVASVPAARAAMGSGGTTPPLPRPACGITVFATTAGLATDPVAGSDRAIVLAAALSLLGAAVIAPYGTRAR